MLPRETVDLLLIACCIVPQLDTLISRRIDALHSAVLTVGQVKPETSANIVPYARGYQSGGLSHRCPACRNLVVGRRAQQRGLQKTTHSG